ncbi:acyl--CoA ligase [Nodularia spumigena]|uniref:Putative sulfoacetate--CoA ligase n=1 Tax=Nodularia spumigena UHCC 0039 TaxID=1914872 RepID=A0A2S0Q5X6_NODSP|nr:acyl--CoA ligase [Nodularia spumigena]AVZ29732.1 putative sulfoacetate--CoA ligase [Nodularia spumigena UHCC 0039]
MHIFDILTGKDDHPALLTPDQLTLTYQQLRTIVADLVAQLHSFGLGKGDRIAIAMTNSSSMACIFLAASLCGTAAPLNPKYKQEEFAFYYEDLQAKALITLPGTPEAAITAIHPDMLLIQAITNPDGTLSLELSREIIQPQRETSTPDLPQADDVAIILHTSGTTSRPKRVPIRHRNLIASAQNIIGVYSLTANDINLCLMPLFHIHGLVGCLLATLASGGTFICPTGFNALEFWQLVERYKPTWYSAAPTIHQMILARASRNEDIVKSHSFRFIRSSSAPLPPVIIEQMEAVLNVPVVESYSMTEAAHQMTSNPLPPKNRKPGSVGYGHGVEVGIMDEDGKLLAQGSLGEVVVKGANVIDGYENNPQANATAFVNGWFRTGDQGKLDPDGYLYLTGRIKELINRGGEKISPLEIDDILLRHPAVAEALAFAVPHKTLGEEIHAAVVLKSDTSEQELKSHCSQHLAEFKIPKQIHILEALPRGATGKLQRLNMAKFLKLV